MATNQQSVLVGACTVSIGTYVTGGAVGTGGSAPVDVGHTNGPVTWTAEHAIAEVISERSFAPIKIVPTAMKIKVKVPMLEVTPSWLRIALKQASGNVTTGTSTLGSTYLTGTLVVGDPTEIYHNVTLVGAGPTGSAARTVNFWKAMIESVGEIAIAKGAPSVLEVVFSVLKDDTATGTDKYMKLVDA